MNSLPFNMGFSVHWSWFAALSCLLCMAGEVRCNCTQAGVEIEGGDYKLTKNLDTGSMLIYQCPEDYYPYPALVRVCQANGTWRPAPKRFLRQKCRLVECPDPNVMEYGSVEPIQDRYFVHNKTRYECYSGYSFRGSATRVCLPNGKWSGSTPICSHDSGDICADPGVPPGGTRSGNVFDIGDKVKYNCDSNMFLVGSSERECQENGQWTGIEPACYYKHTYDTPLEVSEAFSNSVRNSLTELQSLNDTMEGRTIRISKNGTLNIYIGLDISESITKEEIKNATKAVSTLISKISSFSVSPNYEIVFFSSEIYEAVKILDFLEAKKPPQEIMDQLNKFDVGDRLQSGTDLNQVFLKFLELMAIIKKRAGSDFKDHRHVLIFFTDGAYNMGGSPAPTVQQIKNLVYMNQTNTAHGREDYLDIYIFGIGSEIFDDDLKSLTTGIGPHYFRVKNLKELQDTFDEIIDEGEVRGLCGLHRDYSEDTRQKYPWWAYIVVQRNGVTRKCLGSLVSTKFILTAAHCFTFGDLPKNIQVEIDDGQGKLKKVKRYILHPNYNISAKAHLNVKEFYDYDVALIQLEEDVKISTKVRPICLPCTKETSDAMLLTSEATCKQQEKILLKNHHENLMFLTKDGSIKQKNVIAKLGSNRDECISHALQATGITTKNAKDAVTDNFLCTGGLQPQRDHIACTGDSGGAVFKNYQQRTIQIALVSWGTKNMCAGGGLVESDSSSRDFHINLFKVLPFLKSVLGNDDQDDYAPTDFLKV